MTMSTDTARPVLMLGGYGSLGARTSRFLRHLHPEHPIIVAGRNIERASALAQSLGHASGAGIDLGRADLGLPDDIGPGVVVTALRDLSLNTMRYAQARGIPYIALSDAAFEIGPLVARAIHAPTAPVLLLGHSMGGVPALASLHFARDFRTIDAIEIGLVFDPEDPFGPASAVDMDRIARIGPAPMLLDRGRWRWVGGDAARRRFTGVGGAGFDGEAVGFLDVLSLAGTAARSIRVDVAVGQTEARRRGEAPSHEVIIEITGERLDGVSGRFRHELVDPQGYAALSARGVAVAIERLLGLVGGPAPEARLHLPETIVASDHLMRRLGTFGVEVRRLHV